MSELEYETLFDSLISIPSISGHEADLAQFVANWARQRGLAIDLWETDERDLRRWGPLPNRFIPLKNRPTLVVRLEGSGGGRSLIFNGHSDVVDAPHPARWTSPPFIPTHTDGKVFGRGACDVKGAIVSALWAIDLLRQSGKPLAGDVLLELIPGEEDCVGLGTLTSLARGYTADACVVLEPTESEPRCASRGGLRFEITCTGKAVHGTVKWLGIDAIAMMRHVLDGLAKMETAFHSLAVSALYQGYPIARPITVDRINGGEWQGMICDCCQCSGYVELLPDDALSDWKNKCQSALYAELSTRGVPATAVKIEFPEAYTGHLTDPSHELCQVARQVAGPGQWAGFNSGCEAGLRASRMATPTLVWGPGSLAQAHAVDEYLLWQDVATCARHFAALARGFCV